MHYQATELFLELSVSHDEVCSEIIAESMIQSETNTRIEGYQRFALIWRLSGTRSSFTSSISFFISESSSEICIEIELIERANETIDSVTDLYLQEN